MKIGIVTHRLLHNYGGTLQAFALQEVLRRMGHEPITIDYLPNEMTKGRYVLAQIKTLFYYLTFRRSRHFFPYPELKRKPEFASFMSKHLNLTERVMKYKFSILKKYGIEALIAGSDQIWRGAFNSPSLQPDLYLRFAEKFQGPKIAYAASFGTDEWEYSLKLTKECAKYARINTSAYVYHKHFCNHTWETFPCRVRSHLSILLSAREIDILNVDINSLINKGRLSCIDAYSHNFR